MSKTNDRLVGAFFALFLVMQLFVPLVQLTKPRPVRFGWQMYSAVPTVLEVLVEAGDSILHLPIADHVVLLRAEPDYRRQLPPHLCRTIPGAAVVLVRPIGDSVPLLHRCTR